MRNYTIYKCVIFITHIMSKFKLLLHCIQCPQIIFCWRVVSLSSFLLLTISLQCPQNHAVNWLQQRINKKCKREVYRGIWLERSAILNRRVHLRLFPFFLLSHPDNLWFTYLIVILTFQVYNLLDAFLWPSLVILVYWSQF